MAKAVEHESVDMATAHSRVVMKNAASEQHGERGAPACQKDRRYAGHMETVVQEPFCLRCRHSDADTAALAVVRVGGVEGAEPSAARVDEEDCPTEGAARNERERVAVCPERAAISERVVGR